MQLSAVLCGVVGYCRVMWGFVVCCGMPWSAEECCGVMWGFVVCCAMPWDAQGCCKVMYGFVVCCGIAWSAEGGAVGSFAVIQLLYSSRYV